MMKRALIATCILFLTIFGLAGSLNPRTAASQTASQTPNEVSRLVTELSSLNATERAQAACELKYFGERAAPAIPDLMRLLGDDVEAGPYDCHGSKNESRFGQADPDTPGKEAAIALAVTGNPGADALLSALRSQDWKVKTDAAFGLGLTHDNRVVAPLIGALSDGAWQVRRKAAWSLGLVADESAIAPLNSALNDSEAEVRSMSAWALGLKGDSSSVEPLISALKDNDPRVQSQAAWALGLKGDRRAAGPLAGALEAKDEEVRKQAAWALGLKGDSTVSNR